MTRTLADMAPAERAACVGRWCVGRHSDLVILAGVEDQAVVVFPNGGWRWDKLPDITPRFDLPRAWTPQGEPVPGYWEYEYRPWPEGVPEPITDGYARCYVTDWEDA